MVISADCSVVYMTCCSAAKQAMLHVTSCPKHCSSNSACASQSAPVNRAKQGSLVMHACVFQVKLGPPLFVPNGQIGLFGTITQFKSLIKTRSAQLDVAAAGPALGCIASAALFLAGLTLSRGGQVS